MARCRRIRCAESHTIEIFALSLRVNSGRIRVGVAKAVGAMEHLSYASAASIAAAIKAKKISPIEVVDAFIERIETRNCSLNAFVFKGYDDARAAAKAAEERVM